MPRHQKNGKKRTKIARRLKLLGLSQTGLAKATGKGVTLINHYCCCGIKTARVAKFYSRFLACAPEELIDFEVINELD